MIDYKDIGNRIRTVRKKKNITQKQLAEIVGVGTTHISHIETGNTIPSLKTVIDIINALHCSADELLCIEIEQARPRFNDWFFDLLAGCSDREIKIISGTVKALIESLQHFGTDEK
jgi:transcriptional regulator with XRE-family HTH domain